METSGNFARAADVVIDLMREMLDELRGMRVEMSQGLTSVHADLEAMNGEIGRVKKKLQELSDSTHAKRPASSGHGPVSKPSPNRPPRRRQ